MKILALDIGGTAIKSALFDGGTNPSEQWETPSDGQKGGPCVIERAMEVIARYPAFDRIGVSTAGQVDIEHGVILFANENIPHYTHMPVKALLEGRFGRRVSVLNDVHAAALGEATFGAGKALTNFICVTLGTGIGGGIFIEGKLYRGAQGVAGEIGHLVAHPEGLPCACGQRGCWEQYASAGALLRLVQRDFPQIHDGRELFAACPQEPKLQSIVDAWIDEIVLGLASLTHVFNPESFVLGGGILSQPSVLEGIRTRLYGKIMPGYRNVQLLRAALGNLAGVYGAMEFARLRDADKMG